MDGASFVEAFAVPPAAYRPAPFFVLNDEHEGEAGESRITRVLEDYRRLGFGGAFLHPRPGLITEYLSPRWFDLIRHATRECVRLGLVPYLYDENSYPSGFAGGHVAARAPEARTRYVTPVLGDRPADVPQPCLAIFRWTDDRPGEPVKPEALGPGDPWIAFVMRSMEPLPWHGETACPSLLHPRTTEAFIASTYDSYRHELGELWPAVPAIFTDEPHLPAQGHGPWSAGLHLTPDLLGQFRQRRGYDLPPHLPSLFYDVGDFRAVRFDLYDLMHELWMERWALPLERWCDREGIALTGHYLEHDWPCPYATPGHVHLLAHMHWPGTDLLETFLLEGHDAFDIQNLHPAADGQEPQALHYLRQVHSVANQFGKDRVLDECWGAGGHDSTPADWARIGRWLIVHGVNLLNPHLSFLTIRGTRKTDHPQTFSDHSPWWEHLRPFNDELSRLCWASNLGRIEQRILVVDPTTTGFCVSRKADCLPEPEPAKGSADHSAAAPPDERSFRRALASVIGLQAELGELSQALSDAQADFDLGDEYVLEEASRAEGGRLTVGRQTYELIVWPGCLTNLRRQSAAVLESYLAGGGLLYGVRPAFLTIDGRASDTLERWDERFADRCRWFDAGADVVAAVLERVRPRLRVEQPPATGLASQRRVLPNAEIFVVVNASAEEIDSPIEVESGRAALYRLDPGDATGVRLEVAGDGDAVRSRLRVAPRRAVVLLAIDEDLPTAETRPRVELGDTGTPLPLREAIRSEPNVLVVDSCELEMGGERFDREAVYSANARLWRGHGFETNGWMSLIQYRDQLLAQNEYVHPDSGGAVTYRFDVAVGLAPAGIRLAVEMPEVWRITVNDRPLDVAAGERWLDDRIVATEIGGYLVPGENVVRLDGRPFDVRREVDQIYLLGDFACRAAEPGFSPAAATPLALGSWRRQGLPFYDRTVGYAFDLPPGTGRGTVVLDPGDWAGSFLLVEQAGRVVARLWEPPYRVRLDPASGRSITIRVVGLPKNLLGPWHDPARPRRLAWPGMWHGPNVPPEPQPGDAYDLLDLGLFAAPRWIEDPPGDLDP